MSPVTCHLPPATCHQSPVTCTLSHITCHMSNCMCHRWHITCHLSPDHHSFQLQLLWKSKEVWLCGCGTFGEWEKITEEEEQISFLLEQFKEYALWPKVCIPLRFRVTGRVGKTPRQMDTLTYRLRSVETQWYVSLPFSNQQISGRPRRSELMRSPHP